MEGLEEPNSGQRDLLVPERPRLLRSVLIAQKWVRLEVGGFVGSLVRDPLAFPKHHAQGESLPAFLKDRSQHRRQIARAALAGFILEKGLFPKGMQQPTEASFQQELIGVEAE